MINQYKKLRKFGNLTTPFGGKTRSEPNHMGVDIANATGTPIPALDDGVVISNKVETNGLGNVTRLQDKNGNIHQYAHLQKFSRRPGERVARGSTVAPMGSTGNSYSPNGGDPSHTDIRIITPQGKYKNPTAYL